MALQLNLLHEEITELRQRQRDPLKLGIYALVAFGVVLFLYYGWNAYQTIQIKSQLNAVEAEWTKVEPKVTAAQQRADELHKIINSTKVLDGLIDSRFYWAPFLARLAGCVSPNIQLVSLDGSVAENGTSVSAVLEGISAASEPRAAAEEFRQLLIEQLGEKYSEVKVEFRNLEDLDTVVNLAGAPTATARFVVSVSFNPAAPAPVQPTGAASTSEASK
ncbi:MAG: PilN domain-containing protein [Chthoniobacterales bacterium]